MSVTQLLTADPLTRGRAVACQLLTKQRRMPDDVDGAGRRRRLRLGSGAAEGRADRAAAARPIPIMRSIVERSPFASVSQGRNCYLIMHIIGTLLLWALPWGVAAMPIRTFVTPGGVAPEAIAVMNEASHAAYKALGDAGQPKMVLDVIAQRIIIEAARRCERDPTRLVEAALPWHTVKSLRRNLALFNSTATPPGAVRRAYLFFEKQRLVG